LNFKKIDLPFNSSLIIKSISAGFSFSLILLSNGEIYSFGSNENGELGNKNHVPNSSKPILVYNKGILKNQNIIMICAGYYHSIVLSENGNIYSWVF
jgi:alpha-tubulin suppressor-like RCC1 family protein